MKATFQQRYYQVNSFLLKPDGPVILYTDSEGVLTGVLTGFVLVATEKVWSGALGAWFHVVYPDRTVTSLSSSVVVEPVYNFHTFDEQVALSVGSECVNVLPQTTAAFEAQIKGGMGKQVKALPGAPALGDVDFHYMIADAATMASSSATTHVNARQRQQSCRSRLRTLP